jgi:hypothetical protein
MSKEIRDTHQVGAKRHPKLWFGVNCRACTALAYSDLSASDPAVQKAVSKILLQVLDGIRVDEGYHWDATKKMWTKEPR